MEVGKFAVTLGAGMVAGAAAMMMIPRQSSCYRAADDAARTIKRGVKNAVDDMMD